MKKAPIRRRKRRVMTQAALVCLSVVVALLLGGAMPKPLNVDARKTAKVKAAFLYNFIKFVKWPESKFMDSEAPYVICILGKDPFGTALDRTVDGKTLSGRPIIIRRITPPSKDTVIRGELEDCHVLFISASERHRNEEMHALAAQRNILTISDQDHFTREGGMIGLVLEQGKIIFEVNHEVIKEADLKMSSKLLKLARIVTTQQIKRVNDAPRKISPARLEQESQKN